MGDFPESLGDFPESWGIFLLLGNFPVLLQEISGKILVIAAVKNREMDSK
jgi:hypothetical protein